MRDKKFLVLLLSLLPLSLMVKANHGKDGKSEPALQGYVSDAASRKPVQGVTISITSPKLQGEKSFITDASGSFKISQLPAGEVTIILEKKGYKPYRRDGVVVKEGTSIKLTFDLKNETVAAENDIFHPLLRMLEG